MKLFFADGTTAFADVLVGADGIKSAVRATMYRNLAKTSEENNDLAGAISFQEKIQPSWTGTYAYRALVETETLLKRCPGHQAAAGPMIVRPHSGSRDASLHVLTRLVFSHFCECAVLRKIETRRILSYFTRYTRQLGSLRDHPRR